MDQIKSGKFIAKERKSKSFIQRKPEYTIFKEIKLNPHYNDIAKKMTATVECSHFLN